MSKHYIGKGTPDEPLMSVAKAIWCKAVHGKHDLDERRMLFPQPMYPAYQCKRCGALEPAIDWQLDVDERCGLYRQEEIRELLKMVPVGI